MPTEVPPFEAVHGGTDADGREIILLRTTELSSYLKCRQAWWWAFEDHLKPRVASPPLRFGGLVHKAMEARYPVGKKRGPHPAVTFAAAYEAELDEQVAFGFKDSDDNWHNAKELGIAMLNNFVETFGEDEEWEVIASEMPFQVTLHLTKRFRIMYVGVIDGVWRHRKTKELWLNDWKTAKAISVGHLALDPQVGGYWSFGPTFLREQGIIKPTDTLKGINFTFMRKAKPDERPKNQLGQFLNKDGTVSKSQPAAYFLRHPTRRSEHQAAVTRARALDVAKEMMRVRLGKVEVIKNASQFTCPMCSYKDMCELHEAGQDWEAFRDQTMTVWDPYAEHELTDDRRN